MKFTVGDVIISTEYGEAKRKMVQIAVINGIERRPKNTIEYSEYNVEILYDSHSFYKDDDGEKLDKWMIRITDQTSKKMDKDAIELYRLLFEDSCA